MEKTYSANKAADCDHIHDSAVMWWYLDVALQHWNTPESFFSTTIPTLKTKKSCAIFFESICNYLWNLKSNKFRIKVIFFM